jgi:CubicO group peptidase (beta-lactamase class C family)
MIVSGILMFGRRLLLVVLTRVLLPAAFAAENVTVSPGDQGINARIERVVAGLSDPVAIPGRPGMQLADRMKRLRIPGVSIAVIHDGRIEWARGFGVAAVGGPPVTSDTLFQAGSISASRSRRPPCFHWSRPASSISIAM